MYGVPMQGTADFERDACRSIGPINVDALVKQPPQLAKPTHRGSRRSRRVEGKRRSIATQGEERCVARPRPAVAEKGNLSEYRAELGIVAMGSDYGGHARQG